MITTSNMLQSGWLTRARIIGAGLALTCAALLGGCSAVRLVYSQAPDLTYWWLDGYVDFNGAQSLKAKEALGQWFAWHRRTQLPEYAALLDRAADEMQNGFTAAQACQWLETLEQRVDVAVEQALPPAAAIAATLDETQLRKLEEKQAKTNDKFRDEFLEPDRAKRMKQSVDRAVERAEQLYGRLTLDQRERIAKGIAVSPFDADLWFEERQRRQRDLRDTLAQLRARAIVGDAAVRSLRGVWQRVSQPPDANYRGYQQRLDAFNCQFFAELHNGTTAEQRKTAQARLRGWAADARQLAATAS